jgi:hypothetical protein
MFWLINAFNLKEEVKIPLYRNGARDRKMASVTPGVDSAGSVGSAGSYKRERHRRLLWKASDDFVRMLFDAICERKTRRMRARLTRCVTW